MAKNRSFTVVIGNEKFKKNVVFRRAIVELIKFASISGHWWQWL